MCWEVVAGDVHAAGEGRGDVHADGEGRGGARDGGVVDGADVGVQEEDN